MTDSSRSYQQFFAELKRRHVFRVMAVYGIVAFVLLQVVDLAVPALLLPEWTYRLAALILLLGFPVAIVLAWAFEMTPHGMQKTQPASPAEIEELIAAPASQRWPAGLMALAGAAALVAGTWWIARHTAAEPTAVEDASDINITIPDPGVDNRPSLAVLPFVNMSGEEEQECFSDGMTDEILNTLAKVGELRVAGRTSAFAYKNRNVDLREIGADLGVGYLIEGSVRKAGDQLRITTQLIDAADGSHLWSEQYDRPLADVFAVQTEIARAIADELRVPLGLADPSDLVQPLGDLEAYDLYLAARARVRERGAALNEAIVLYEAAIARDSTWAPAWAGLAEAIEIRQWWPRAWDDGELPGPEIREPELEAAERAARRALELDPRNATAHVALGSVMRNRREVDASEQAYLEALAIDPDNAEAHQQYAELLQSTGRIAEAVQAADRAVLLDATSIRVYHLGYSLFLDGRGEEAIEAYEWGTRIDPENGVAFRPELAWLHFWAGRDSMALDVLAPLEDEDRLARVAQWITWFRDGDLAALPDSARENLDPWDWMEFDRPDSAAAALSLLLEDCPSDYAACKWVWEPVFDGIRDHPLVRAAMREHGLAGMVQQRTPPDRRRRPLSLARESGVDSRREP